MKNIAPNQFVLLIIGLFSQLFTFFLNTATLSSEGLECHYTFSGNLVCNQNGQEITIDVLDCMEDGFCQTIKSTPIYGGFSFAFGILVLGLFIYDAWHQEVSKYLSLCLKLTLLSILSVALIFQILIPVLYIANEPQTINLKYFPIVLEFLAFLLYATNWQMIMQKKVQRKESLLG